MLDDITQLAIDARGGDADAVVAFIRRTQTDVWRFCAHLVGAEHADDVTQDVYLRALTSLAKYRGDSPARLWLLAIARNACADQIRMETRRRRIHDRASLAMNGEPVLDSTDVAGELHLTALVDALAPDQRTVFVLTQLIGLSYAEAASVCDCPIGTVRSRVARAREALLRELAGSRSHESDDGEGRRTSR